mmetsp:Transcript_71472/g.213252  ORF Transcript_71472/g.213252 Transcript_71472/m.213252 type:complete len:209 (+) Transcript_71472:238-864(+)
MVADDCRELILRRLNVVHEPAAVEGELVLVIDPLLDLLYAACVLVVEEALQVQDQDLRQHLELQHLGRTALIHCLRAAIRLKCGPHRVDVGRGDVQNEVVEGLEGHAVGLGTLQAYGAAHKAAKDPKDGRVLVHPGRADLFPAALTIGLISVLSRLRLGLLLGRTLFLPRNARGTGGRLCGKDLPFALLVHSIEHVEEELSCILLGAD